MTFVSSPLHHTQKKDVEFFSHLKPSVNTSDRWKCCLSLVLLLFQVFCDINCIAITFHIHAMDKNHVSSLSLGHGDQKHALSSHRICQKWRDIWWVRPFHCMCRQTLFHCYPYIHPTLLSVACAVNACLQWIEMVKPHFCIFHPSIHWFTHLKLMDELSRSYFLSCDD